MKNAKHTPGPWTFSQNWHGEFCINNKPASIADSHLIAAAPTLLKACEYVLAELQLKWPSFHGDIKAELESAIAKATGGA